MGLYTGVMTFSVIWWIALFTVLPFGVRVSKDTEVGFASSAPENPKIGKKLLITTLISILLFFFAKWLIDNNILDV